jgi:hypothetical protein
MSGGSITLAGAELTIPPGALSAPTQITITETTDVGPAGYTRYSPVYRFEPDGTSFSQPLTIRLPYTGDAGVATLFWSRPASQGGGWERVGGVVSGGYVEAQVDHFSTGFIADGVDYTETPDRSCVYTRYLDTKRQTPSNIGIFFAMDDCWGRPITDLQASEIAIFEDGSQLSVEASPTLLDRRGFEIFTSLVIDMSNSTSSVLPEVILAAKDFVTGLQQSATGVRAQVSIQLFDGQATLVEWQAPTLDTMRLLARLDALATYTSPDGSSTNLYGGVINALSRSAAAQEAFRSRNAGGAFTTGYVVLFTDGGDTSGYRTREDVIAAIASSTDDILAVGLSSSADYNPVVLRELTSFGVIDSPNATTLSREFRRMAARIQGQARRTYLLGYCSPKRTGTSHTVTVQLAAATSNTPIGASTFDATGFAGGCLAQQFIDACTGKECGGMGCGGCDDRIEGCQAATGQCDSFCTTAPNSRCDNTTIVNIRGYSQMCLERPPTAVMCGVACVDTSIDSTNCGGCGNVCGTGGTCVAGACQSGGAPCTNCGGTCRDFQTDASSCGGCGNVCGTGGTCVAGACQSGGAPCTNCGGTCRDFQTDASSCGGCGNVCGTGGTCVAGACQSGGAPCTNCGGTCRTTASFQTDASNCAACGNACGTGGTCVTGACQSGGALCDNCGGTCRTTASFQTDASNCAACGNACGTGGTCVTGACQTGGIACVAFDGVCTTAVVCSTYGPICTSGGYPTWPMPGTTGHARNYSVTPNIVLDTVTGREWQRAVPPSLYLWSQAKTYCANLVLDGKVDWRLPSRIEAVSIIDYTRTSPMIDTVAFPGAPGDVFWTSTPQAGSPTYGWAVSFANSGTANGAPSYAYRVRCVR